VVLADCCYLCTRNSKQKQYHKKKLNYEKSIYDNGTDSSDSNFCRSNDKWSDQKPRAFDDKQDGSRPSSHKTSGSTGLQHKPRVSEHNGQAKR
jgi:hypothetical protein